MHRVALLGLLVLAGCSGGSAGTPAPVVGPGSLAAVSLRNATPGPIVYVAAGEGTLALLDIRPTMERGEYEARLVPPGETVPVTDIIGYQDGLGVNFFLYRVDQASGQARFAGSYLATAAELARHAGLVTITPSHL